MSTTSDLLSVFGESAADGVVVPDVCGDSERIALHKLESLGLAVGQRLEQPSRGVTSGTVFGTVPRAGSMVEPGTPVAYVVATDQPDGQARAR